MCVSVSEIKFNTRLPSNLDQFCFSFLFSWFWSQRQNVAIFSFLVIIQIYTHHVDNYTHYSVSGLRDDSALKSFIPNTEPSCVVWFTAQVWYDTFHATFPEAKGVDADPDHTLTRASTSETTGLFGSLHLPEPGWRDAEWPRLVARSQRWARLAGCSHLCD
jgi:hypothetical protein